MSIIEIIPKKEEISKSLELSAKYNAAFEYNDFFIPAVLDSPSQIDSLISFYSDLPRDRSNDTLHGAFLDIAIHSSDARIRQISDQRMRQSMNIAKNLGIRGVIFHTNLIANFYDKIYRQNWLEKNLAYFSALAAEYPDIEIFIENMFDLEPDMFAAFGEAAKNCPTLHLCLDVAHANLSHSSLKEWMELAHPYIRHIHINDNDGHFDLHQAVGQGNINWQEFDQLMRQYQIHSSLLIENNSVTQQQESLSYLEMNHFYPFCLEAEIGR